MPPLKDELLSRLAEHANVAQFISFGPHPELPQRHARLRGHRPDHRFATPEDAVDALLQLARLLLDGAALVLGRDLEQRAGVDLGDLLHG